jgi:hypothetical protein
MISERGQLLQDYHAAVMQLKKSKSIGVEERLETLLLLAGFKRCLD